MVRVDDILSLPSIQDVELAAPCPGAGERAVYNVGIVDCPPDYDEYEVYKPGELILTNLGFAYNDPALAERSLLALIKRNVSAIAVKRVYHGPVSDRVRAESTRTGVPIYLYSGAYHEQVAYDSLDLIKRAQADEDHADAVDGLLSSHDGDAVRASLYAIAGVTGAAVQCFATLAPGRDMCSQYVVLGALADALERVRSEQPIIETARTMNYRGTILAFVSYTEPDGEEARAAAMRCERALAASDAACAGASAIVALGDGDLAVQQALDALDEAHREGTRLVRWGDVRLAAFAAAAQRDRMFSSAATHLRELISDYDHLHGSELMRTAECLVRTSGDVKEASELLFQHPNTVRYRMRKIKDLLGMPDEPDRSFLMLLSLAFLPVRNQ